jgi:malonyl-CoA decarboxylase
MSTRHDRSITRANTRTQPIPRYSLAPGPLLGRFIRSITEPVSGRAVHDAISLCRALLSERGEVSGARLAIDLHAAYRRLDGPARKVFFGLLVEDFSVDPATVGRAAEVYLADLSQASLMQLQAAVEPRRQELFRRFNMAPGGTKLLVEMRAELLRHLDEHPEWASIDADLVHLFRSWFNRGFLVLQRIDWGTSAVVLERLIEYESVHQIQGWDDLRRRLAADRRCYGFFSPALPEEPLIFLEVALTRGMPATVRPLLDPDAPVVDPSSANCAVFYSITNCQEGLRGVSFGNVLIKQVVEDLGREFHRLKTFATLSPIPGFCQWLVAECGPSTTHHLSSDLSTIVDRLGRSDAPDASLSAQLRSEISGWCAHYLLHAKRGKAPLDPVARFHLANGASLERLNWMGDSSPTGLSRSLGLTANYVYRLKSVEQNHERYATHYSVVASRELERLAKRVVVGSADTATAIGIDQATRR